MIFPPWQIDIINGFDVDNAFFLLTNSKRKELANTDFEAWAKESFEIAAKFAYRNGAPIGIPKGGAMDCTMVAATPVLPVGYVVSASRIADRRMILAGYRLADLLTKVVGS
jgi:S1/P1 Nuclease